MPVYMDRHSIPQNFPFDELMQMHRQDLAIEEKHGCKGRTFWHDKERGIVNCLIEAPSEEHVVAMHAEAHGDLPSKIIEVSPDLVLAFIGKLDDMPEVPARPQDHSTALRTVMFTDLKDSTAMTNRLGDVKAMELLRIHDGIIRSAVDAYNGREVKHTGDGMMLSFGHAPDAVACATAIQRAFAEYNAARPEVELHVRIGLAAGEPVAAGNDLFGCTVQRAARICAHAEPGQTLLDDAVYEQAAAWQESISSVGETNLKGFEEPVQVFALEWTMESSSATAD